jgi:hypothetical protein
MPPSPAQQPKPSTGKQLAVALGCLVPFGLIAIIVAIVATSGDGKSGDNRPGEHMAAIMCEDFVKDKLKSPGSAEFPGVMDSDYAKTTELSKKKPWKYRVDGHVDAQNGFGALVRIDYECSVSTKDNEDWTLDNLDMDQR